MGEYETDLVLWSEHQSTLLRRIATGEAVNEAPDWDNIIEEIEQLGRSDRRELRSQIQRVLEHLIKLRASPATDPRSGWSRSIVEAQLKVSDLLDESPSLRREVASIITRQLPPARKLARMDLEARGEQPIVDLEVLSFTETDVLGGEP